jgi:uncharacterized protein
MIIGTKDLENQAPAYDVASHGNYHLFEFRGKFYVYDIERMNVLQVDEKLYFKLNAMGETAIAHLSDKVDARFGSKPTTAPKAVPQSLTYISLNVAQVCNLSCVYCYGVDGEYGTKGKMTEEVAFQSVDFLIKESQSSKNISIGFFGGEPLLNFPLIKKVVDYSREAAKKAGKEISFSITTNGTKFTDDVNSYLNANNFGVIVSFDGDEEAQNKNRPFRGGRNSYAETKPKIEKFLASRKGKATARATITNHTTDLKGIRDKLLDMGFHKANATVATLSDYALENREVNKVEGQQIYNINQAYEQEADELYDAIKQRHISKALRESKVMRFLTQLKAKNKSYHPCGVGRKMVGIAITGDVYPCHRFVGVDKFKLGNVKDFDTESRAQYSTSYTQSHPVCSRCWAKYQCGGGGCIQDNEVMMGKVDKVNTRHCSELKHQVKLAIDLYNKLNTEERNFLFQS